MILCCSVGAGHSTTGDYNMSGGYNNNDIITVVVRTLERISFERDNILYIIVLTYFILFFYFKCSTAEDDDGCTSCVLHRVSIIIIDIIIDRRRRAYSSYPYLGIYYYLDMYRYIKYVI